MEYILELAKEGFHVEIKFNPYNNSYVFWLTKNGARGSKQISAYELGMLTEARCIRGFLKSLEAELNEFEESEDY